MACLSLFSFASYLLILLLGSLEEMRNVMRCFSDVCRPPYRNTNAERLKEDFDLEASRVFPTNRIIQSIASQVGNSRLGDKPLLEMAVAEFASAQDGSDEEVRTAVEKFEALKEK